jgi:hypothetical protein
MRGRWSRIFLLLLVSVASLASGVCFQFSRPLCGYASSNYGRGFASNGAVARCVLTSRREVGDLAESTSSALQADAGALYRVLRQAPLF